MANTRLSDLSVGGAIASTDLFYAVETAGAGGVQKDGAQIAEYIRDIYNASVMDSATIEKTENDPADTISFSIVAGSVDTTHLADEGVTYAKIQDVSATDRLLGRSTAGAGVVEEIPCTAAGRALIAGADEAAQRATLSVPQKQTGSAAPATTPGAEADLFVDTTNDRSYMATGVASSADWQELPHQDIGTWTPTFDFATTGDLSVSYSQQDGFYIRIGQMVFVWGRLAWTPTYTTASGLARIEGLPFTVWSGGIGVVGGGSFTTFSDFTWPSGYTSPNIFFGSGTTRFSIRIHGDGAATAFFDTGELPSGTGYSIVFNGWYRID